jgi:2-oxoglutarate ferredoxin oxidoreductase subunit delta
MPRIQVDETRCKGCERCKDACPQGVISMSKKLNEKGYFFAIPSEQPRCIGCRLCAVSCPDVAIQISVHGTQYQFFNY